MTDSARVYSNRDSVLLVSQKKKKSAFFLKSFVVSFAKFFLSRFLFSFWKQNSLYYSIIEFETS